MANLGNFNDLNSKENWNVVVTNYQDFKKIVYAFVRYMHPSLKLKTDEDAEKYIQNDSVGGEDMIKATYAENKKYFAEGKYVYSQACSVVGEID